LRRGAQHVNEAHQRDVEAEDGVLAAIERIFEERIANQPLLVVDVLFLAEAEIREIMSMAGMLAEPAQGK
jgi:hypothetical protein